jgi:hypothetical protein
LVFIPLTIPRLSGMKSKNRVRSDSVAIEDRTPRLSSGAFWWTTSRFVVFPESPGPK